jgi:hypothetical protein
MLDNRDSCAFPQTCEIPSDLQHFIETLHHHPPDGISDFLLPSDHPLLRWMAAQAAQLRDATTHRPQLRPRSLSPTGSADNARASNRSGRPRLIPPELVAAAREKLKALVVAGLPLHPRKDVRAHAIEILRGLNVRKLEHYTAIDRDVIEPVESELRRLSN